MSSTIQTAVSGINHAVARATHAAANIVNGSSTGGGLAGNLVHVGEARTNVAADAAVIKASQKQMHALLDIKV